MESTPLIPQPPLGWHVDPDTGAWMRDTIHHMGRRCLNWDYCGKGVYHITLVLNDRSRPLLGELTGDSPETAAIALSELGRLVEGFLLRIPEFAPEIEVLGYQLMPEHLHVVLRVNRRMRKPVGYAIRGVKGAATKAYWAALGFSAAAPGAVAPGLKSPGPLFAEGYVDTILFDNRAIESELAYMRDNPRRLWAKRAHPELFKVLRDLRLPIEGLGVAHFAAIGNQALLRASTILQVQCSRAYFAYARNAEGEILRDAEPVVKTPEFDEKLSTLLAPAGWPYLPGEKKMTRVDACVLNRLAQLLAGDGAVEINYRGAQVGDVDGLLRAACLCSSE